MAEKSRADPNSLKKQFIKKLVREELVRNPEFEKFLTRKKVKGQYIVNITNKVILQDRCRERETLVNLIKFKIHSTRPIDYSFTWSATPQGHRFWEDLQDEYSRELCNKELSKDEIFL